MKPQMSRWMQIALLTLSVAVVAWRIPILQRSQTHRTILTNWVGSAPPAVIGSAHALGADSSPSVFYIYAEACPYCAIDHERIIRAVRDAATLQR